MIDSRSQNTGDAQFTRELPDNELDIVTGGGRKAGETPLEDFRVSNPPTPIDTVIGWIKGLFN